MIVNIINHKRKWEFLMFILTMLSINIITTYIWGDWRHWIKYQSTILYLIVCDLIYNFLTYNYPLWDYEPKLLFPNHTITNLTVMFIAYTSVVLIFLGKYPSGRVKQILWNSFWIIFWTVAEWVSTKFGEFTYHNGWNLLSSFFFNIALFLMIRLHFKKPLLAYGLSVIAAIVLMIIFDVPISKMK
jgi:hypothetical protein